MAAPRAERRRGEGTGELPRDPSAEPCEKESTGSLAETPRVGGEDWPPSPLPPPFPSLRGTLFPPACQARRAAAPATVLRSFFFFLPAKPATSSPRPGRRRLPLRSQRRRDTAARRCLTPAAAEGYTSRSKYSPPPFHPPTPATCAAPCLLPQLSLHTGRCRGRPPAREPPRFAREGGTARVTVPMTSQRGAAPRRKDFAERKHGLGHPRLRPPRGSGRPTVCAEEVPVSSRGGGIPPPGAAL